MIAHHAHERTAAMSETGTGLAPYANGQLEGHRPGIMTPQDAKALDDQLRACTRAVLREGTDYGVIPGLGDNRKVLYKPGAEKLLQWFGLAFTCDQAAVERDDEGRKEGVTYRCTITTRQGTQVVATCEGYAGYDEEKFYQTAEQAQFKAEAKERYWAAKDGRPANPNKWKHLDGYRAPWNTVIKMAQKRAVVGATIDATAAAGLFGQEEDDSPVAEDGSTWYEQALEAALTFTDLDDGRAQYVDAAQAARDGLCSPRQATHIQNRIQQRVRLLKTATPADAEDLGRAAEDSAPAVPDEQAAADPAAGTVQDGEDPDTAPATPQQLKRMHTLFTKLEWTDRDDRLRAASILTGLDLGSSAELPAAKAAELIGILAECARQDDPAGALTAKITEARQAQEAGADESDA